MSADNNDDEPITQILTLLDELAGRVQHLTSRVEALEQTHAGVGGDRYDGRAAWVIHDPPETHGNGVTAVLQRFVAWYNAVYIGMPATRARRIPDCWPEHPGLAAEIATLAYSWLDANLGRTASPRDAQYWHHTSRPGFADRLTREWVHPQCVDGRHRGDTVLPRREQE